MGIGLSTKPVLTPDRDEFSTHLSKPGKTRQTHIKMERNKVDAVDDFSSKSLTVLLGPFAATPLTLGLTCQSISHSYLSQSSGGL